jgi:hypothetical protein
LFANRSDVDFNNVNELKPLQTIDSVALDFDGNVDNPLIAAKFPGVDLLIMHITGAEGELLQIGSVGFKGESRGLNKKVIEGLKYEIRAQLKDHTSTKNETSGGNFIE